MSRTILVLSIMTFALGCSRKQPESLAQLREEFVFQQLAFSPTLATQVGYHQHKGVNLDSIWTTVSQTELTASASSTASSATGSTGR